MANALLSLLSSIVGGMLVLAGQFFARRAENRRQWLLRLHEAAADLATSYFQEAAVWAALSPHCGGRGTTRTRTFNTPTTRYAVRWLTSPARSAGICQGSQRGRHGNRSRRRPHRSGRLALSDSAETTDRDAR